LAPSASDTLTAAAQIAAWQSDYYKSKLLNPENIIMKKLLTFFAALLATSALVVAGEYQDISIEELSKAIADGKVTLLDVNGSGSYARGHIPGAIDFKAQSAEIAKLLPADKEQLVVAYCGGPGCNAYKAGAQAAADLGYKNVRHLAAGISGWLDAGKPTEAKK